MKEGNKMEQQKHSQEEIDRAFELLNATLDILNKLTESIYVEDFFSQTAFYDGTDCDGCCLKEDIEILLDRTEDNE